ncbi:FAD/NAD(P)-binding domain-containing protein [Thozetella sp. PMI_491]|nr:FAD/NAD(P)-binding domain-containing protein [Thozetella sp. PMI_491]
MNNASQMPPLNVLVIGSGLAGVAAALALSQAGLQVTVFERMPELREVGAGIQLSPNATRLLGQWGVLEELRKHAFQPETGGLRSYQGTVLSRAPPGSIIERIYRSPYLVVHRADLLRILVEAAKERGVLVRLGCEIQSIDFTQACLRLTSGEVYAGDFILGADGDRSVCRDALLGRADPPTATGDVVLRIAVPRQDIDEGHPSWELMQHASVNVWMGPGAHGVSYLLKDDILNMVVVQADEASSHSEVMFGPQPADLDQLKAAFGEWDPALQGLLDVRQADCTKWSLFQVPELSGWRHSSGKFALIGDAAHAILPYLAQGAAQAFEDAGVLGGIFARRVDKRQIPDALAVFEQVRKPRVAVVRERTLAQKQVYSLPTGPAQRERDAKMALGPGEGNPNALADPGFQKWLWGYDAMAEGSRAWSEFMEATKVGDT